jgi:hypothetical protein
VNCPTAHLGRIRVHKNVAWRWASVLWRFELFLRSVRCLARPLKRAALHVHLPTVLSSRTGAVAACGCWGLEGGCWVLVFQRGLHCIGNALSSQLGSSQLTRGHGRLAMTIAHPVIFSRQKPQHRWCVRSPLPHQNPKTPMQHNAKGDHRPKPTDDDFQSATGAPVALPNHPIGPTAHKP